MEKRKIKKTLFVGIGGSGIDSILSAKKCFVESYGEVPPMIGFLGIDTDNESTNKKNVRSTIINNEEQKSNEIEYESVCLEKSELLICTVQNPSDVYDKNRETFEWLPELNTKTIKSISGVGAGQVRSNGRFIAMYNHKNISNQILALVNKINAPLAIDSQYTIDYDKNDFTFPIIINIAFSIAGGTGGGMFIDIMAKIDEILKSQSYKYVIYPWIILPDIYRAINAGPVMANVYYNAYGALRDLDYIMHLTPNDPPLDMDNTQPINQSPAPFAFVLNNTNNNGVTFDQIEDITDTLGRSMFLPSNDFGSGIASPFDNIITNRHTNHNYKIANKQGWVASIGSAELVYHKDKYKNSAIQNIIQNLYSQEVDATKDVEVFINLSDVALNQKTKDISNALKHTNEPTPDIKSNDLETEIESIHESEKLTIENNFTQKEIKDKDEIRDKIDKYLDSYNGIKRAEAFIAELIRVLNSYIEYVEIQKSENNKKIENAKRTDLNKIKKDDKLNLFEKAINTNPRNNLETEMKKYINLLNEGYAYDRTKIFIGDMTSHLKDKLDYINSFEKKIRTIGDTKAKAHRNSKFKITIGEIEETDDKNILDKFIDQTKSIGGINGLIDKSMTDLQKYLNDFVDTREKKGTILNKLNDVMKEEDAFHYLDSVINLSSPLCTYDDRGISTESPNIDKFIIIGLENTQPESTKRITKYFKTNNNTITPIYVSTSQKDRITFMTVYSLLPIFAINNLIAYEQENKIISQKETISNYINEKWRLRMEKEEFSLKPKKEIDSKLKTWICGFIFEYIKFDEDKQEYWMLSKNGNKFKGDRFVLGKFRNDAFHTFKLYNLFDELDTKLRLEVIDKEDSKAIDKKIIEIKENRFYLEIPYMISEYERNHLDMKDLSRVNSLLLSEINFIDNYTCQPL